MLRYLSVLFALFLLPHFCLAAVQINEIAWMGTATSVSDEWIELHNTGNDAVALSGWKIIALGSKINIPLEGSIAANGYYLIERTDDNAVPGVSADLITSFSTGLTNTGMTLQLFDAGGALADEVVGGKDWSNIGGDATTKDTPQRTGTGWITAAPTPRAPTVETAQATDTGTAQDTNTENIDTLSATNTPPAVQDIPVVPVTQKSSSSGSSAQPEKPKVTRDTYRITIVSSTRIYKDIPVSLHASVTGLHDEPLPNARIVWNLGDGTIALGADVEHTYRFTGEYPVIVSATENGLTAKIRARAMVIAQDVHISSAQPGADGFVTIVSPVDIDLSGWSLRDGRMNFTFPEQTQVFGKIPVTFPNAVTGMYLQQSLALHRADGKIMSAVGDREDEESKEVAYPAERLSLARAAMQPPLVKEVATTTATTLVSWNLARTEKGFNMPAWGYYVLMAIFVAIMGIIVVTSNAFNPKREVDAEAEKYTFIELDSNLEDIT